MAANASIGVFLARDVRDIIVSHFFQATKRKGVWDGGIKAFIRDKHFGIEKVIVFNVEWFRSAGSCKDFKFVTYEDMQKNMASVVTDIWKFSGLPLAALKRIDQAVINNQFEKMQERERSGQLFKIYGNRFAMDGKDDRKMKVREGKIGGFRKYLDDKDIEYCEVLIKKYKYREIIRDFVNNDTYAKLREA